MSNGLRLIHKNSHSVTAGTQTLNTSGSDLSLREVDDALDNDVVKRREVKTDTHHAFHKYNDSDTSALGQMNDAFEKEESDLTNSTLNEKHGKKHDLPLFTHENNRIKGVHFEVDEDEERYHSVLSIKAEDNSVTAANDSLLENKTIDTKTMLLHDGKLEGSPSSKTICLLRPDNLDKTAKSRENSEKGDSMAEMKLKSHAYNNSHNMSGDINNKIVKRQKKISNLLRDLISSNDTIVDPSDDIRGTENEQEIKINSSRHSNDNYFVTQIKLPLKPPRQAGLQANNTKNPQSSRVFPYTWDLINFPCMSSSENVATLEKYGAKFKKENNPKKKSIKRTEEIIFMPRLNLDEIDPDRNCFSDQDVADSELTDLEQDAGGALSDTEGVLSSRLIPVYSTERTLSIDFVNNNATYNYIKNEGNSDLEITDCEVDDQLSPRQPTSPRILPGAMAAHQMRSSSAHARSRDFIPPSAQIIRRGGTQNDSRRRYLALNSLRRKAYKLALQSQIRGLKRPTSTELLSYNTGLSSGTNVTIMSKV